MQKLCRFTWRLVYLAGRAPGRLRGEDGVSVAHKFQGALSLHPQGDRKGPHPAPHRPRPYYDPLHCDTPLVLIVRAGAVWSGVGTLAVALGDEMCQGERGGGKPLPGILVAKRIFNPIMCRS